MIYASVYFTILYKDSQKLEKTRKYRKPMPVNQRVLGSSPSSGAFIRRRLISDLVAFFRIYMDLMTVAVGYVWLGSVGTSSDSIPPTTSSRAPPVHEATGGHAIQTYPTATSEHTQ